MHNNEDILNGNLKKVIVKLSLPIMASNFLHTAYNLIDTFWVGRLGAYAIAAVTISFPVVFFTMCIAIGIGLGGSVLMSHAIGKAFKTQKRKDKERVNLILSQTFTLILIISFLVSIIGFFMAPTIVSLLKPEKLVFENAVVYMRTIFIGIFFMFIYFIFQAALRALGNTKTPMKFVLVSVIMNLILDPLMIFGIGPFPKLGVFGAALATVISRALISIIALYHLTKNTYGIRLRWNFMFPRFKIIKEILHIGIPSSVENGSRALAIFLQTTLASLLGTIALASLGIVSRLFSFFLIPAMGLSVAISTITAQNYGAGKQKRIFFSLKQSMKIGSLIMGVVSILAFVFAKQLVMIFTAEPEVIYSGTLFLRMMSPFFMLVLIRHIIFGFFNGIKRTDVSMVLSLIHNFIFKLVTAYLLAFALGFGFIGFCWSYPIMMVLGFLLSYLVYLKIKKHIIKKKINVGDIELKSEAKLENV